MAPPTPEAGREAGWVLLLAWMGEGLRMAVMASVWMVGWSTASIGTRLDCGTDSTWRRIVCTWLCVGLVWVCRW